MAREVCIILPALNEERTIGRVIRRIPIETLRVLGYASRILVVDGHSVDATLAIARARGAEVVRQDGRGKGNALRQVVELLQEEARDSDRSGVARHYVVLDADGTYAPESISDLVAALDSGYDMVLASRFLGIIHPGAMDDLNRIGNQLLTWLFRMLNGLAITDACTGMYAFNDRLLRNLNLHADGFDVEAELFTSASLMKARIAEVPIDYARRGGDAKLLPLRSGLQIGVRMLTKRMQRAEVGPPLTRAPRGPPHPCIGWTGIIREAATPDRLALPPLGNVFQRF